MLVYYHIYIYIPNKDPVHARSSSSYYYCYYCYYIVITYVIYIMLTMRTTAPPQHDNIVPGPDRRRINISSI